MKQPLAVVIPMYNEELNAEKCVRAMISVITQTPGTHLYVVNDGSRDRTSEILNQIRTQNPEWPLTIVDYGANRGYGYACLAGARKAHQDGWVFALFMDSDLTNDPALIPFFLEKVKEDRFDVIKASRYTRGGGMKGVPFYRVQITTWGNRLASSLFGMGIRDCTNGFRAVRLSLMVDYQFEERGFPSIMEELYYLKKQGARATEVPYILTARKAGEGKSKFSYSRQLIFAYLKYSVKASLVRYQKGKSA